MTLVLQGITLNDEPMSRPLIGRFDERGGTLGRSDNATFTLPDPERLISRVQAQILFRDEGYWIENVSTANSTLHNGRPLSAGMRILLHEGDELRIGGYTLMAAFESDETSATILRGRTVIMQPLGPPTRPRVAALPLDFSSAAAEVTHSFEVPGAAAKTQAHTALLTASMRAALEVVLDRIDHSLPEEVREDLQRLFGEAFRKAYEAKVRSLNATNETKETAASGQ